MKRGFLERAAGQKFYNLSRFTFETLLADADNIKDNFESYLNHFSENVIDIIHRMEFQKEIDKMADNGLLYLVIKEFCTTKAYLGADKVSRSIWVTYSRNWSANSLRATMNRPEHTLQLVTSLTSWQSC